MHVSGQINRNLARAYMGGVAGAHDDVAKLAAKKPTAKEILEKEMRLG